METKTGLTQVLEVNCLKHRDGENTEYSISMTFQNVHADMRTYHYSSGGNSVQFILFGMTPDSMAELGNKILATAAGTKGG